MPGRLPPNPALNRTGRYAVSTWRASVRPAGQLVSLGPLNLRLSRTRLIITDSPPRSLPVKTYSAVIERDPDTGLFVGFVPGFPGAHSQGATLDELNANLREVISMLLEDGEPILESEFVGVQNVAIA